MSDSNPYAAPEAAVVVPEFVGRPASRWRRLFAAALDTVLFTLVWFAVEEVAGPFEGPYEDLEPLALMWAPDVPGTVAGLLLWAVLQGPLLVWRAQTVGKFLLSIRIADGRGAPAGIGRIAVRELPIWVANVWPIIGAAWLLIDSLFIFGAARRCAHDYLAGTQVLDVK